MTEEKEYVVEQSSVGIFHHFLPPFILCGIMFGLRLLSYMYVFGPSCRQY